jgi:hypothetical protein
MLRQRSPIRYDVPAIPALAWRIKQLVAEGSFMEPYKDAVHDVPGWMLLDRKEQLAMLIVGLEGRVGVVVSESPTRSIENAEAVVRRMTVSSTLEELAAGLDERTPFVLDAKAEAGSG